MTHPPALGYLFFAVLPRPVLHFTLAYRNNMFFVRLATVQYTKAPPESAAAALWIPPTRVSLKNPDWGPRSMVHTHGGTVGCHSVRCRAPPEIATSLRRHWGGGGGILSGRSSNTALLFYETGLNTTGNSASEPTVTTWGLENWPERFDGYLNVLAKIFWADSLPKSVRVRTFVGNFKPNIQCPFSGV